MNYLHKIILKLAFLSQLSMVNENLQEYLINQMRNFSYLRKNSLRQIELNDVD